MTGGAGGKCIDQRRPKLDLHGEEPDLLPTTYYLGRVSLDACPWNRCFLQWFLPLVFVFGVVALCRRDVFLYRFLLGVLFCCSPGRVVLVLGLLVPPWIVISVSSPA